jgi:pimeloyl-ACP methyl ester carboxylesterase
MERPLYPASTRRTAKVPFVLVHGAWHGGWCWNRVAERLRALGHDVYTPTLTGLGERAHLLRPDIDLSTHIDDVVGVLDYEDLVDAVLVGHSYGGMVIAGAAERAPLRVGTLVYLDAFFPENGKALLDYVSGETLDEIVNTKGEGWRLPSPWSAEDFGITNEQDADWVNARLGDQPYKTFTQPLTLTANFDHGIRGAFIQLTQERFSSHAARARESGFAYFESYGGGHNAMVTQPGALVELLLTISENRPQERLPGQGAQVVPV